MRPVKLDAGVSLPCFMLGGLKILHEAIFPFSWSMSKVQFRLSMTRTFGATTAPVLVTFSR